jgi:hypothetical protein
MRILAALAIFVAGCASTASGSGSGAANRPVVTARNSYVLDGIELRGVRLGEVSAAREWQRSGDSNDTLARDDGEQLRGQLATDLGRDLALQPTAPLHLRVALTLQDTADFEGFAAETSDVTLNVTIVDEQGAIVRTITLREAANAPLQRSASQRTRLDGALDRLSRRLAAQL